MTGWRPPLPINKSPIKLPGGVMEIDESGRVVGEAMRHCKDPVHVFADFGWCQCGERFWKSPIADAPPEEAGGE